MYVVCACVWVGVGPMIWVPEKGALVLQLFIVFVFLWTSSLFAHIHRFIVSIISGMWYFHRYAENATEAPSGHRHACVPVPLPLLVVVWLWSTC